MNRQPMMSVAAAARLPSAIAAGGADPDSVFRAAGLDRAVLDAPDGLMASSAFPRLLEGAAQATGDPDFGLHYAERIDPRDVGTLAYVVLNSPTIAAAIANIERYLHIHNTAATVWFGATGPRAYLRYLLSDPAGGASRQHNEYAMTVLLSTLRIMAGTDWTPLEIQFPHESPAQTTEHGRIFGAPVAFGCAANAVVVEPAFVDRSLPAADARLYRILRDYAERMLAEVPRQDDLLVAVRSAIVARLAEGDANLSSIAARSSMSPRTLGRRLQEAGTTLKALLDDTRRRLALEYLRDRAHTLTEIAFLLGYSELSAFNRAFRRWTGSTPMQYRESAGRAQG